MKPDHKSRWFLFSRNLICFEAWVWHFHFFQNFRHLYEKKVSEFPNPTPYFQRSCTTLTPTQHSRACISLSWCDGIRMEKVAPFTFRVADTRLAVLNSSSLTRYHFTVNILCVKKQHLGEINLEWKKSNQSVENICFYDE